MRLLLCGLLATFLIPNRVFAMMYSGVLFNSEEGKLELKDDSSGKKFDLTFSSAIIQSTVAKLKAGDYLSFEGARSSSIASIRIDSVNFVGLKDLLGVWQGEDKYCYNFTSFTEIKMYHRTKSKCAANSRSLRKYAYTINPSENVNWVLLLTDDKANLAADLTVKSANLVEISLYDSATGLILRIIKLRK